MKNLEWLQVLQLFLFIKNVSQFQKVVASILLRQFLRIADPTISLNLKYEGTNLFIKNRRPRSYYYTTCSEFLYFPSCQVDPTYH